GGESGLGLEVVQAVVGEQALPAAAPAGGLDAGRGVQGGEGAEAGAGNDGGEAEQGQGGGDELAEVGQARLDGGRPLAENRGGTHDRSPGKVLLPPRLGRRVAAVMRAFLFTRHPVGYSAEAERGLGGEVAAGSEVFLPTMSLRLHSKPKGRP